MVEKERIYKWDNIKGILIICVVLGHLCDNLLKSDAVAEEGILKSTFLFIYSFHIPLFVFISGLFSKKYKDEDELDYKRVVSFVTLGFSLKIVFYVVSRIIYPNKIMNNFNFLSDKGVPWFFFGIAIMATLTYITRKLNPAFVFLSIMGLSLFLGNDSSIGDYLYLSRTIVFFPFYYAGYCIGHYDAKEIFEQRSITICSVVVILIFGLMFYTKVDNMYFMRYLFTGRNSYSAIALPGNGMIYRTLAYIISFAMGISIISIVRNKKIFLLSYIGRNTMSVYFWHYIIIWILMKYKYYNFFSDDVLLAVAIVLAFVISLLLSTKPFSMSVKWISEFPFKRKKQEE